MGIGDYKHHKIKSSNSELPKIESKFFKKEFSENDLYKKNGNWVNFFSNLSNIRSKDIENGNSKLINNKTSREIYKNKNAFRSSKMFLPKLIQDYPSMKRYKE